MSPCGTVTPFRPAPPPRCEQTIHSWLRQDRIDRGLEPGLTTPERAELRAAKSGVAELEAELAIHRRASELLGKVVPSKGGSRPSR
jgi:transposase-like protein